MAKQRQIDQAIANVEREIHDIRTKADGEIQVKEHTLQQLRKIRDQQDAKRKPKVKAPQPDVEAAGQ